MQQGEQKQRVHIHIENGRKSEHAEEYHATKSYTPRNQFYQPVSLVSEDELSCREAQELANAGIGYDGLNF